MISIASRELARQLEAMEIFVSTACLNALLRARPETPAVSETIAGGRAIFFGPVSPLSQALAIGMNGPVSAEEFDRLEAFFFSRGAPVVISLCPLADPSVLTSIARRGYRITHYEHTLIRDLLDLPGRSSPVAIGVPPPSEAELWSRTVMEGFGEGDPMPEDLIEVFTQFYYADCAQAYMASVEGHPVGGATLSIHNQTAMLYGDSTLPLFRARGIQNALIAHRLNDAAERGCTLAIACVAPASGSHRNYERAGFQVAYTKTMLVKDGI